MKRIAYSAIAIPGEPDSDGEILTPEEIAHAAHKFLEDYRIVDPDHVCQYPGLCTNVGAPVESYITPVDMTVTALDGEVIDIPKDSWIGGFHVEDDDVWRSILNGTRKGVSLTGVPAAAKSMKKERVLIRDLGPNWKAKTVSIVKNPAVPKAKFFSVKSNCKCDIMAEDKNIETNDAANKSKFTTFVENLESAIKSFKEEEDDVTDPVNTGEVDDVSAKSKETFVTKSEFAEFKEELLEAVKASKPQEEEDPKDKKIAELEAKIKDLEAKAKSAGKSKGLDSHLEGNQKPAIKNLYEDDGRDGYGRVIRR